MAKRWGNMETVRNFIFLDSIITADGDCSHGIKRCLLLGRKAMTKLDSILKKQRYYFPKKGPSSQSYDFPVVMYGCESWTIKDHQRINGFWTWCWRKLLRVPWTARSSNQSIVKEINPEYSLEGLMLKLPYSGYLMQRANSLEKTLMLGKTEGGRRRGWQRMGWPHWLNGRKFEQALGDGEGQGSLVCCSPWGHRVGHDWETE